jgi:hypothetical protein
VEGAGVYMDIAKRDEFYHPVSGHPINTFQIPFWNETIDLVTKATLLYRNNKTIGWTIAITPGGPELMDGNNNWSYLHWQLPVKQGLKHMLLSPVK